MDKDEKFDKYKVTENYFVPGKKILVVGATGNWGSHFAAGMAMAAHADLVLVDFKDKEKELFQLSEEIKGYGLGLSVETCLTDEWELKARNEFYSMMKQKFGTIDAVIDVENINR